MTWALQSTAKTFLVGPILDADGVAKTDEVVASIKVTKNGSVGAPHANSTLTHNHTGHYLYAAVTGADGDFDTLGEVEFSLNSGTNAMAPVAFQVLPANIYNSLVLGTAYLMADLKAILATALTETSAGYLAAALKKFLDVVTPVFTAACVNQTIDNPTAAAIGTDAAGKVLVTPAQKLVTDANGKVTYSNAAAPAVGDIRTEMETALGTLNLTYLAAGDAAVAAQGLPDAADIRTEIETAGGSVALIKTAADAIVAVLAGITSLPKWLRGLFRKSAMDATAKGEVNDGGGTFDEATDSNEALRDTAPMGSAMATPLDAAGVRTAVGMADADLDTQLAGITAPTAAVVADAVWDEANADHLAPGSMGYSLSVAGGAADPLLNVVPGAYGAGTAGAALAGISAIRTKTDLLGTVSVTYPADIAATAGARYLRQSDLENRVGVTNVARWSNLDNTTTVVNASRVAAAICYAEAYVEDRFRAARYAVPFTGTVSPVVTDWMAWLAVLWLWSSRGQLDDEKADRYEAVRDRVEREMSNYLAGTRRLSVSEADTAQATAPHVVPDR